MISAIILAAGRSERFGRDKRLELIDNIPMLLATALKLKNLVADTLVVLGPDDHQHEKLLHDLGIATTRCPDARLGMGHSLAHAVAQRGQSCGWLIMPADMPFIQAETVQRVLDAGQAHAIAAPVYQGRRGHPVWFERRFGQKLCALSGDEGARSILREQGGQATAAQLDQGGVFGQLYLIPVEDSGCLVDIDSPKDLEQARSNPR